MDFGPLFQNLLTLYIERGSQGSGILGGTGATLRFTRCRKKPSRGNFPADSPLLYDSPKFGRQTVLIGWNFHEGGLYVEKKPYFCELSAHLRSTHSDGLPESEQQ
jgi:hypothetical protein